MFEIIWSVIAVLILVLLLVMVTTLLGVKKSLEKIEEVLEIRERGGVTHQGIDTEILAALQEEVHLIESHLRTINRNVYVVSSHLLHEDDPEQGRTQQELRIEKADN